MKLINIGFGNMVSAGRLVAIVSPESAPIKRIIQDARERGSLVDATYGRRTRAVIITDSDHVILSAVQPETVANRLVDDEDDEEEEESSPEQAIPGGRDLSGLPLAQWGNQRIGLRGRHFLMRLPPVWGWIPGSRMSSSRSLP